MLICGVEEGMVGVSEHILDISSVSLMFENHSNPRFPGSLYHPRLITLLLYLPPVNWLAFGAEAAAVQRCTDLQLVAEEDVVKHLVS